MNINLLRPKSVVYIHLILIGLLIFLLLGATWLLTEHPDMVLRSGRLKVLNTLSVIIILLGALKILWDIYLVYFKVPLLRITDEAIYIKNIFTEYYLAPLSKIENITVKGNKYSSNITINIRKTPFRNTTKRIYEVFLTKDAEKYFIDNNIEVLKDNKPVLYLNN